MEHRGLAPHIYEVARGLSEVHPCCGPVMKYLINRELKVLEVAVEESLDDSD